MHDAGLIYWSFHRIRPVKLILSSPKPSHTVINLIVWLLHTLVIYIHIRHLIVSNWRALLWGLHLTILGIFAQINLIITRSHILDGSEALVQNLVNTNSNLLSNMQRVFNDCLGDAGAGMLPLLPIPRVLFLVIR